MSGNDEGNEDSTSLAGCPTAGRLRMTAWLPLIGRATGFCLSCCAHTARSRNSNLSLVPDHLDRKAD